MSSESHWQSEDQVLDFLAGVLPDTDASRLTDHLAGCEECRRILSGVEGLVQRSRKSGETVVRSLGTADQRFDQIMEALEKEEPKTEELPAFGASSGGSGWQSWLRLPRVVIPAMAVAAVGFLALLVPLGGEGPDLGGILAPYSDRLPAGEVGDGFRVFSRYVDDSSITRSGSPGFDLGEEVELERALQEGGRAPEFGNVRAYLRLHSGNSDLAASTYQRVLDVEEDNAEARLGLIVARVVGAETQERVAALESARGELEQLIDDLPASDPVLEPALYNLVRTLDELDLRQEAEASYRRYRGLSPPSSWEQSLKDRLGTP